jgi:hypothetical protein
MSTMRFEISRRSPGAVFDKLCRKWTVYNPIRNCYLEIAVAIEACNRLVSHLTDSTDGNMNLLLSFTDGAFYRHNKIGFVGHRWSSTLRTLPRRGIALAIESYFVGVTDSTVII